MFYKLTLEKLDYEFNTITTTTATTTEEMVSRIEGVDGLKLFADNLVEKFRKDNN